jgi:hypothetical protein
MKNGKQRIVLTVSEIECFCVLFQSHQDFSQLRPRCNWNSIQNCSFSKTASIIFCFPFLNVIRYFIQIIFENLVKVLFLKSFCEHLGGVNKIHCIVIWKIIMSPCRRPSLDLPLGRFRNGHSQAPPIVHRKRIRKKMYRSFPQIRL